MDKIMSRKSSSLVESASLDFRVEYPDYTMEQIEEYARLLGFNKQETLYFLDLLA